MTWETLLRETYQHSFSSHDLKQITEQCSDIETEEMERDGLGLEERNLWNSNWSAADNEHGKYVFVFISTIKVLYFKYLIDSQRSSTTLKCSRNKTKISIGKYLLKTIDVPV